MHNNPRHLSLIHHLHLDSLLLATPVLRLTLGQVQILQEFWQQDHQILQALQACPTQEAFCRIQGHSNLPEGFNQDFPNSHHPDLASPQRVVMLFRRHLQIQDLERWLPKAPDFQEQVILQAAVLRKQRQLQVLSQVLINHENN